MTDQLKLIVGALNAPPFNKTYNLISFDGLQPQQLLQLLSDVLCIIQKQTPVEIRTEASDETALRVFTALRVLKFRPPTTDPDQLYPDRGKLPGRVRPGWRSEFRRGLVEGEQGIIWGVLEWLLERVDELSTRAYLSKYLIKVPVPNEFLSDPEVEALNIQAEELMEQFKEVHREAEGVRSEGLGTEDVRRDLSQMEAEREQLGRRLARVQRKAESAPDKDAMLKLAKALRTETEREANLALQKQEQRNGLVHAEQKMNRLHQAIKELDEEVESTRPEDLIKKLEEENQINAYMVKEKLPKEIGVKRKAVQELASVLAMPAMDKSDLDAIMRKISDVNNEFNALVERRNVASDPTEDKMAIFRNQALIVQRKKEAAAERLQEARSDLARLDADVRDKKSRMRDPHGNEIVTSVQFKNYVNKLRGKTNIYKKKRSELQDLRAEMGVLSRTEEILRAQLESLKREAAAAGEELKESPADAEAAKPQRPQTASNSRDLHELKKITTTFEQKVEEERRRIEAMLLHIRPLRDDYQEMCDIYRTRKQDYETAAAGLESGYSRLEQEVKEMREDVNEDGRAKEEAEMKLGILKTRTALLDDDANRIFKEKLQGRIREAEAEGGRLKDASSEGVTDAATAATQIKLWRDLLRLMEIKRQHHH